MFCNVDAASPHPADAAAGLLRLERHRAALDALVEMGMDLARMVHRRAAALEAAADAAPDAGPGAACGTDGAVAEATVAFDRIARTVRRTVSLARVLDMPAAPVVARGDGRARVRIIRTVEDTIHREVRDAERAESLRAELYERMDAPEFDDVLGDRPVDEVVREIAADLGISAVSGGERIWQRRTPEVVAAMYARARGKVAAALEGGRGRGPPLRG